MSTTLVIFGASGDLSRRKLIPALFTLACKGRLPEGLRVVGFARSPMTDERFRQFAWESMSEFADLACMGDVWETFAPRMFYVQGSLGEPEDCGKLGARLRELEGPGEADRLYYLSIAPTLYEQGIGNLRQEGLTDEDTGWRRVVIEKPFGRDLASAIALDKVVHGAFDESRVYRIDHYLGKETVQNLLVFRFANTIFEPLWNRNYIDQVQITVAESVDVGNRGEYYDASGVLRDMIQNHLVQLMTMVAMEPPNSMSATALRNEKVKVLQSVRRWSTPAEAARDAVGGQYAGYLDARGVPPDSRTPTYAALRLYVDNWRWQGVPFYLRSGKAMGVKASEVAVQFRRPPHTLFDAVGQGELPANTLGLYLQPDEGVHLRFEVKVPDAGTRTQATDMEFHYESSFAGQSIPGAYERLLQDALAGDASLFIRSDQIEQAWELMDPLLRAWEAPGGSAIHAYDRGSWGPAEADALLAESGHAWLQTCGAHGI